MVRATISEVKNGLSAYLRRVKAGEAILVMERKTPVARIVPVGRDATRGGQGMGEVDRDAKLARLVQAEVVTRHSSGSPLNIVRQPIGQGCGLLEAVLEERSEEHHEGGR